MTARGAFLTSVKASTDMLYSTKTKSRHPSRIVMETYPV